MTIVWARDRYGAAIGVVSVVWRTTAQNSCRGNNSWLHLKKTLIIVLIMRVDLTIKKTHVYNRLILYYTWVDCYSI